jgi:hypothetical protein
MIYKTKGSPVLEPREPATGIGEAHWQKVETNPGKNQDVTILGG